jgi:hypothetical protein
VNALNAGAFLGLLRMQAMTNSRGTGLPSVKIVGIREYCTRCNAISRGSISLPGISRLHPIYECFSLSVSLTNSGSLRSHLFFTALKLLFQL